MKNLSLALIIFVIPTMALSADKWRIYKNDKYEYEVQHPDSYETIITGAEYERDGRKIRIAMKEMSRLNGINIEIHPDMSLEHILLKFNAPKPCEIDSGDITINTELHNILWKMTNWNGVPAVKKQVRHAKNDELFMTSLIMNRVVITAHLWPGGGLDEKFAELIISTFKWQTNVHYLKDADVRKPDKGAVPLTCI